MTTRVNDTHHTLAAMAGSGVGTLLAVEEDGLMLQRAVSFPDKRTLTVTKTYVVLDGKRERGEVASDVGTNGVAGMGEDVVRTE